jgi:hypothetical protein
MAREFPARRTELREQMPNAEILQRNISIWLGK